MATPPTPSQYPAYETILQWQARTGMSRDGVYKALSRGDLRAVKLGKRVLLDVPHGLAWMATLPTAKINLAPRKVA